MRSLWMQFPAAHSITQALHGPSAPPLPFFGDCMAPPRTPVEAPTLGLILACYIVWIMALFVLPAMSVTAAVALTLLACALHSSLQHEVIHGHPFRDPRVNAALVWPALGLLVPYARFRDSHLAHHQDARLTDPYDDPESNYLEAGDWARMPAALRAVRRANNTLLGRMLLGPLLGQLAFVRADLRAARDGDRAVAAVWAWHLLSAALVLILVSLSPMPLWAYLLACYLAMAVLKIRTFLEHQAHAHCGARSVIIEDRGPLSWIFLNNNLHLVHHMHPRVPWYRLPQLYRNNPQRFAARNQGYVYRSYAQVIARHLLRAKDPVVHPLWRR